MARFGFRTRCIIRAVGYFPGWACKIGLVKYVSRNGSWVAVAIGTWFTQSSPRHIVAFNLIIVGLAPRPPFLFSRFIGRETSAYNQ